MIGGMGTVCHTFHGISRENLTRSLEVPRLLKWWRFVWIQCFSSAYGKKFLLRAAWSAALNKNFVFLSAQSAVSPLADSVYTLGVSRNASLTP